jgi:ankyrin repeat protein
MIMPMLPAPRTDEAVHSKAVVPGLHRIGSGRAILLACLAVTAQPANGAAADELTAAITRGQTAKVVELIGAHPSLLRSLDRGGRTPLGDAALHGEPEVVGVLLEKGADPNAAESTTGSTPLHTAVGIAVGSIRESIDDYERTIALLIAHGADPDRRNRSGKTPLHVAAGGKKNAIRISRLLIEKGADPNRVTDPNRDTLLHAAASNGTAETIDWLIAHGLDPNARDSLARTPLHEVGEGREADRAMKIASLVSGGADVTPRDHLGYTPLHNLCRIHSPLRDPGVLRDQLEAVRYLAAHGADVNAATQGGFTVLESAVIPNNIGLVDLLLSLGSDPSSALDSAIGRSRVVIVERLIAAGAHIEGQDRRSGFSPLEKAILRRDVHIVDLLIRKGANVNAPNQSGQRPLSLAKRRGSPEIVDRLIAAGARP